jgi:hypothetical protein
MEKFQSDPHWKDFFLSSNTSTETSAQASAQATKLVGPGRGSPLLQKSGSQK